MAKSGRILDSPPTNRHLSEELDSGAGDCASVTSAAGNSSQGRLKAEGFPLAPLIEAVIAIEFLEGLSPDEAQAACDALVGSYAIVGKSAQRGFVYDASAETLTLQDPTAIFRLEGSDETEVALVRPEGLSASQMAPYKSWEQLYGRFARDWELVEAAIGTRAVKRLGVRSINRVDIPMGNDRAEVEEYFRVFIKVPDGTGPLRDFYLRLALDVPEVGALATVQSAVMPPAIEGKASVALDIDLYRDRDLPANRRDVLALLDQFRGPKNQLYRQFLTERALEEFR
jgi:uncharacterized protein (TIGR04255 family)